MRKTREVVLREREVLLELAARLGSISEACRRQGVDRSAYYRALRSVRQSGESQSPPRSPLAVSAETEARLLRQCMEYPEWGCDRLALYLTLTGFPLSSPTVQKILVRNGLGRMAARRAAADRDTFS